MKKITQTLAFLLISSIVLPSCGLIIGGSNYVAHIEVKDKPNAKIFRDGMEMGTQYAHFKVPRKNADKFSFVVKENGCPDQTFNFRGRTFRGWALVGTILTFIGTTPTGIPLPWGVVADLAAGSIWKPDQYERFVNKEDYKNYTYSVTSNCIPVVAPAAVKQTPTEIVNPVVVPTQPAPTQPIQTNPNLEDVLYLKNGNIIHGIIVEQVPNDFVKLQTRDGNLLRFKTTEIDRMTREAVYK